MWLVLCLVLLFLVALLKYRTAFRGYENVDNMFPGPSSRFLFGNALEFYGDAHDLYKKSLEYRQLYRRSLRVWVGPILSICLETPEELKVALNSTRHTKKSLLYDPLKSWIGTGSITSHGEKWRTHRKAVALAFNVKIYESFVDVFNANTKIFSLKLEEKLGNASFDVLEMVERYTLDNICQTAMGTSVSAQEHPKSDYEESIKAMLHISFLRATRPWLRPDFIFNLTKHGSIQKKALKYLHGFTRDVINKKIKERKMKNETEHDKKVGKDENDIGAKKKGHDTVSSAISFALYSLADHPNYQDKVYEEILSVFEDDRDLSCEDLNNMIYMEMVIKETLRLYPSVPLHGREMEEDLKLDEFTVCPKGAQVFFFSHCTHRDPSNWQRPHEFYPEHFLPELVAKRHPYAYIPFSAGPRKCIGQRFAMMEMKIALCEILRKFKVVPATPRVELEPMLGAVLKSKTGVMIAVEKRKPLNTPLS